MDSFDAVGCDRRSSPLFIHMPINPMNGIFSGCCPIDITFPIRFSSLMYGSGMCGPAWSVYVFASPFVSSSMSPLLLWVMFDTLCTTIFSSGQCT